MSVADDTVPVYVPATEKDAFSVLSSKARRWVESGLSVFMFIAPNGGRYFFTILWDGVDDVAKFTEGAAAGFEF